MSQDDFNRIKSYYADYAPVPPLLSPEDWADLRARIQVVIPAGGKATRLRAIVPEGYNKISIPMPNGDTLLEYNIRMYRDSGFRRFLLLLGHAGASVEALIGRGQKLDVEVVYSREPEPGLATGGALRWALDQGELRADGYLLVHNGGDIFMKYPGDLPRELASSHTVFEKTGSIATMISVPESPVQGSVIQVEEGRVKSVSYEGYVPVPYHAAVTLFSPEVFSYFDELFPSGVSAEFERVLFPRLAAEGKLTAMAVASEYFLPVKTEKEWSRALEFFKHKNV